MYFRVFSLKDLIMKKIVALALVAVALCAVGCGDKPKSTVVTPSSTVTKG
jgi:hypothetical protein